MFGEKREDKWKLGCLGIYNDPQTPQLSIMFWGYITSDVVDTLKPIDGNINARKYIRYWKPIFGQSLWKMNRTRLASQHISLKKTMHLVNGKQNILAMNWPQQSPDLNVTENSEIKTSKKRVWGIKTRQGLIDNVLQIWILLLQHSENHYICHYQNECGLFWQ